MVNDPKPQNGDQPATQHNLSLLAGELSSRFDRVDFRLDRVETRLDGIDSRLDQVDTRLDSLESGQAAILKVANSIDQQLKEWQGIPDKVERLHKKVFGTREPS